MVSKPDFAPRAENHGVHIWAGMKKILSDERMKRTSRENAPVPDAGCRKQGFSLKSPGSAGSSFSSSSFVQPGWVKSPVLTTVIPFFAAQSSSRPGFRSPLVAMEKWECMCRSAMNFMLLLPVQDPEPDVGNIPLSSGFYHAFRPWL